MQSGAIMGVIFINHALFVAPAEVSLKGACRFEKASVTQNDALQHFDYSLFSYPASLVSNNSLKKV